MRKGGACPCDQDDRRRAGREEGRDRRDREEKLTDVDAVIIPVAPGHVLIDISVDARHPCGCGEVRDVVHSRVV